MPSGFTSGFLPAEFQGTSFNMFEMAPDKMIRFLRNTELDTDAQRVFQTRAHFVEARRQVDQRIEQHRNASARQLVGHDPRFCAT